MKFPWKFLDKEFCLLYSMWNKIRLIENQSNNERFLKYALYVIQLQRTLAQKWENIVFLNN